MTSTNSEKKEWKPEKPDSRKFCYKVYFKHDGCSMLMFDKLLAHQAIQRANILRRLYNDWRGQFIITK